MKASFRLQDIKLPSLNKGIRAEAVDPNLMQT